jgi:hypothetical protein
MGLASRLHGSSIKTPKILDGILYALPYALFVLISFPLASGYIYATLSLIWVVIWKNKGHADGFQNYVRDSSILSDIAIALTKPFKVDRNSKTYDFVFWSVKGFFICALPALLLQNFMMLLFGTFAYAIAYWFGYRFMKSWATETGEFLGGVIAGLGFLI